MVELHAVYAIWLREITVFLREKERVVASLFSPLLWLFVFGAGIGSTAAGGAAHYQAFVFPGVLVMSLLFTTVFYGLYIIWDRKIDFLKEVLVAPASRSSIFLGKALGGVTDALLQSAVLLVVGAAFVLPLSLMQVALSIPVLFLIAFSTASLGLVLGANLRSQEAFGLVSNFVIWPLFFFSGALFPVTNLPDYLRIVTVVDPVTYGVDALRGILLGLPAFPLYVDVAALVAFAAVAGFLGIVSFGRLQQAK